MLACAALMALGLGACGKEAHPTNVGANNDGSYIDAGPITYQLAVSRELNPYDVEDRQYLAGATSPTLGPSQEWYVVFLWAKNQTSSPAPTSGSFDIVDTEGKHYYPVSINSHLNPYAWTPTMLRPSGTQPAPGTTAFYGPTQGEELLFKINVSAYSNRPLTLEIHASGQPAPSTLSLDL